MNCSKRIIEIINALLEREDFITVSEIAEQLGISKRTIFREMEAVDDLVNRLGMKLEKKTRFVSSFMLMICRSRSSER